MNDVVPLKLVLPLQFESLVAAVVQRRRRVAPRPAAIAIAGGSSTGKSSQIAVPLAAALGSGVRVLAQDMHQKGDSAKLDPRWKRDDPANYGLDACRHALIRFRASAPVRWPMYDFANRCHGPVQDIAPGDVVLLEGLYAASEELIALADFVIYVEAPAIVRLIRRVLRNRYERYPGQGMESASIAHFLTTVLDAHHTHVVAQRKHADIVVRTMSPFRLLRQRFNLRELSAECSEVQWQCSFDVETRVTIERLSSGQHVLRVWEGKACFLEVPTDEAALGAIRRLDTGSM